MTSSGQPPTTAPVEPPPSPMSASDRPTFDVEGPASSGPERLVYGGICLVSGVVAALPAAWIWTSLADPPSARLTSSGLKFGEASFDQVSGITLWFVVVSFGFGVVLGFGAALFGRRHGFVTVVAVLLMSWVGATLMLWFGVHVFGPDHPVDFVALFNGTPTQRTAMLSDFQNGDLLVSSVRLSSPIGLLAWPMGGMVGTLGGASLWPRSTKTPWSDSAVTPPHAPLVK